MSMFTFTNVEGKVYILPEYDVDEVADIIDEFDLFDDIDSSNDDVIFISSSRDLHYTHNELITFYRGISPYISSAEFDYDVDHEDEWKDKFDGTSWGRYAPQVSYKLIETLT